MEQELDLIRAFARALRPERLPPPACFDDIEAARFTLELTRGDRCPRCGAGACVVDRRSARCDVGHRFSITAGTPLQRTKVRLSHWVLAVWHLHVDLEPLSARAFSRRYRLRHATAWALMHRISSRVHLGDAQASRIEWPHRSTKRGTVRAHRRSVSRRRIAGPRRRSGRRQSGRRALCAGDLSHPWTSTRVAHHCLLWRDRTLLAPLPRRVRRPVRTSISHTMGTGRRKQNACGGLRALSARAHSVIVVAGGGASAGSPASTKLTPTKTAPTVPTTSPTAPMT